jgi:hypothetical protein
VWPPHLAQACLFLILAGRSDFPDSVQCSLYTLRTLSVISLVPVTWTPIFTHLSPVSYPLFRTSVIWGLLSVLGCIPPTALSHSVFNSIRLSVQCLGGVAIIIQF